MREGLYGSGAGRGAKAGKDWLELGYRVGDRDCMGMGRVDARSKAKFRFLTQKNHQCSTLCIVPFTFMRQRA